MKFESSKGWIAITLEEMEVPVFGPSLRVMAGKELVLVSHTRHVPFL